jgi:hypothetical protein
LDTTQATLSPPTTVRSKVECLQRLRDSGLPVALQIGGVLDLVIEDEGSYQKLLELVDRLETIEAIREGMAEIDEGKGLTLEEAKAAVRAKYGISL